MDPFLDIFFVVFHSTLVIFNLAGWIWKRTRRLHLVLLSLTLLSWTLLGLFFGFGYCPCTDWHWEVKRRLGERDLPSSYIEYYLDRITPFDWAPATVDALVLGLSLMAFGMSVWLNVRDRRRAMSGKG